MNRYVARMRLALAITAMTAAGSGMAATYTAVMDGPFNSPDTWGETASWPTNAGDIANITNWTVTVRTIGEVTNGVTVNLSGDGSITGKLAVGQGLGASTNNLVDPGATINVSTGGTLGVQRGSISPTLNLQGGLLRYDHYSGEIGASAISVSGDTEIYHGSSGNPNFGNTATVSGHAKLIRTGSYALELRWAVESTWDGEFDIRGGAIRMDADSLKGDVHLGASGRADHLSSLLYRSTNLIYGIGSIGIYSANMVTLTNSATLSPGEGAGGIGIGMIQVVSTSGSSVQAPKFRFAAESVYEVQIQGTTSDLYDLTAIYGKTTGQGTFEIQTGAKLVVKL